MKLTEHFIFITPRNVKINQKLNFVFITPSKLKKNINQQQQQQHRYQNMPVIMWNTHKARKHCCTRYILWCYWNSFASNFIARFLLKFSKLNFYDEYSLHWNGFPQVCFIFQFDYRKTFYKTKTSFLILVHIDVTRVKLNILKQSVDFSFWIDIIVF